MKASNLKQKLVHSFFVISYFLLTKDLYGSTESFDFSISKRLCTDDISMCQQALIESENSQSVLLIDLELSPPENLPTQSFEVIINRDPNAPSSMTGFGFHMYQIDESGRTTVPFIADLGNHRYYVHILWRDLTEVVTTPPEGYHFLNSNHLSSVGSLSLGNTTFAVKSLTKSFRHASVRRVPKRIIRIASVGDSYASGEGTHKKEEEWDPDDYELEFCHRTETNRGYLAVNRLRNELKEEYGEDQFTIEYYDYSCSGASFHEGLIGKQGNQKKQIKRLADELDGKKLDYLLMSIGGNDVGFYQMVISCALFNHLYCNLDLGLKNYIYEGQGPGLGKSIGLNNLPYAFDELSESINNLLNVEHIMITELPDLTKDENGDWCGCYQNFFSLPLVDGCIDDNFWIDITKYLEEEELEDAPDFMVDLARENEFGLKSKHLWQQEVVWIHNDVIIPLNRTIKDAAQKHGWHYVEGIKQASTRHGLCSKNRWFHTFKDSFFFQGDLRGAIHPNQKGVNNISDILFKRCIAFFSFNPSWECSDWARLMIFNAKI